MSTPKPYFNGINLLKAFVLGCDPTAFDKENRPLNFEYVFDLGNDQRYFSGILKNLECIGLSLQNIFVQNLVTDYLDKCSADNKQWKEITLKYIESRKKEFDTIDPTGKIPVLLTSELLYEVLLNDDQIKYSAKDLYLLHSKIPIPSEHNKLKRPLIPLYRHFRYNLNAHPEYAKVLSNFFSNC
ncbi:MAG TPA: hypothetical protein VK179_15355 [Bacteroidales bacterium]|nr:hypothetical protein [Bacteroidales bacterium]